MINQCYDDEKRFCFRCGWYDSDYGCSCPPNEEVYQCEMFMHYHPDEVEEFENSIKEWERKKIESEVIKNENIERIS